MHFKDAAFVILKEAGVPLHYNEITERALQRGLLETSGLTPSSSMGALLYTDTLKENSRFRRGDQKGTFALRAVPPSDIQHQINAISANVKKTLLKRLIQMGPRKFESLVKLLLDEMGLEETSVTEYSGDKGVDVRGTLNAENLSKINVAVQAKRWKNNVGSKIVRELRGSLKVDEHGIIITPSDFTPSAKTEAVAVGKSPISLINGKQLIELLIDYNVGVAVEEYKVPMLDEEFWSEILGEDFQSSQSPSPKPPEEVIKKSLPKFPLPIQASYKGDIYHAELLNMDGKVRYDGTIYGAPSTAAKLITTRWKAVNGWDFWRYASQETGEFLKIGTLK